MTPREWPRFSRRCERFSTDLSLKNDLIVLITDAEESGLLGARLFVEEHRWAKDIGLVLNFEARGNSGVVNMFETSPGNAWMIRGLREAPRAFASSMSNEIYQRMPNDTDLSVFLDAGFSGMNFALIGNHPAYHTELDTPQNLSRESLQHHGSYALSLSRHFGDLDLGGREGGPDAVYFNALGSWLISYAPAVGLVAALLAAVLLGVAFRGTFGGASLRGGGVRSGLYAWLLIVLACPLALMAIWNAFTRIFPAVVASPYGEPYQSDLVRLAALLVCAGLTAFVVVLFESSTAEEMSAGILVPWALLALASAYFLAGGGFLFVWPAFFAALALVLISRSDAAREVSPLLLSVGPLVGALIWAPVVMLATEALQVNAVLVMGVLLAVPLTLLMPTLSRLIEGRLWPATVLLVSGLLLFGWIGSSATASTSTPAPTSLFYAVDLNGERALWASYEEAVDGWTSQVIPAGTRPARRPDWLPGRPEHELLFADAPTIEIEGPDAELLADVFEDDVRTLTVRVHAQGAPLLWVIPDASMATIQAIGVEGQLHEIEDPEGRVQFVLQGVPEQGVVVSFQTFDRQPMALDLVGVRPGFPAIEGTDLGSRPDSLLRRPRWLTDSTLVRRSVWF